MLQRSKAVWDLTDIPLDTPLNISYLNVRFDINGREAVINSIESLGLVRDLKIKLEPVAYNLYLQVVDDNKENRNVTYYAHVKSPGQTSPTSDYGSEDGSMTEADILRGRISGKSEMFLDALHLFFGEVEMTGSIYQYRLKEGDTIVCKIDVEALIL